MNGRGEIEVFSRRALGVGILGMALTVVSARVAGEHVWPSYLFGFLFWWGLSLGSGGIVMLHHLTGGRWGLAIRRIVEAGVRTTPLMAALFLPSSSGSLISTNGPMPKWLLPMRSFGIRADI
jgi:hypothetical protein